MSISAPMLRRLAAAAALPILLGASAFGAASRHPHAQQGTRTPDRGSTSAPAPAVAAPKPQRHRPPNTAGRIPILEFHLIGDHESRWMVERGHFARDLQLLYDRGYRPVSVSDLVDRTMDLPAGLSPVVITFDDASPSQFSYIERNGTLEIDSTSAIGIWMRFRARHPDWSNRAVFCMLPGARAGHAFFGDKGIEGQQTAWRLRKLRWLADNGFELCGHTLWHANLGKYSPEMVQEQIARGVMAIDSAVPGYRVRTFALPLGIWPKDRSLAQRGSWRDPASGRVVSYDFSAILEVSGGPARSPSDPQFNPLRLPRIEVFGDELEHALDRLEADRYVSDGIAGNTAGRARAASSPVRR